MTYEEMKAQMAKNKKNKEREDEDRKKENEEVKRVYKLKPKKK